MQTVIATPPAYVRAQRLGVTTEARTLLFLLTASIDKSLEYASVTPSGLAQKLSAHERRPWSIDGVLHHLASLKKAGLIDFDKPDRDGVLAVAIV